MGEVERQIITDQGKEIRKLRSRITELEEWKDWIKEERKRW